ncbi:MAG: uroporphyrinogen decarboxylase [Firmicutes bacterium]|nr:uroporphyrinogen decarboxylase [Bacillota bacterium]
MSETAALLQERKEIFQVLYQGGIPKRVPVNSPITLELATAYVGENLVEVSYDLPRLEAIFEKICQDFVADSFPVAGVGRSPLFYQILGSKPFVMSSTGSMQHPDVVGMLPEEYSDLITKPLDYLMDTVVPRLYTELDTDSSQKAMVFAKAMRIQTDVMMENFMIQRKVAAKYGYPAIGMMGGTGPMKTTLAPLDYLADLLRSFKGLSSDLRRYPTQVLAACETLLPLMIKRGLPNIPGEPGVTFIPLHMATFIRNKDFEKFYWPTFIQLVRALDEAGQTIVIFLEDDWTRYLDYVYDLPANCRLMVEYGDPQLFKDKLGKKHYLTGFYPATLLHSGNKDQCVDKAKELLDILAPGGRYQFSYDKQIIATTANSKLMENIKAVMQYVEENGAYDHPDKVEDLVFTDKSAQVQRAKEIVANINQNIDSKYYTTWEKYKALHPELEGKPEHIIAPKIQHYEEQMIHFLINLC